MTDLIFRDALTENTFSFYNAYNYDQKVGSKLYFSRERNYPYILTGGISDDIELEFSLFTYQLRNRVLTTKKLKEIMNSSHLPIWIKIKSTNYLMGKGFLAQFHPAKHEITKLLFVACINSSNITEMKEVKFFISKSVYEEGHKPFHGIIKELVNTHPGDVIICNDLLDYMTERLTIPEGGTVDSRKKYVSALVKATVEESFKKIRGPESPPNTTAPIITATGGDITDGTSVPSW
jgi:hypothetical protein